MTKKHNKLFLFLFFVMLVSLFGARSIAHAEEKKAPEVTITTGAYGEIVNVESGKRLNVKGNSSAQEAAVTIYQQDGTTGQKWQLLSFPNGYSLIPECAAGTGRVLNIYGTSAKAGSRICLWSSTQSETQCWVVEPLEDGSFILRSKNNPELCLAESGTGNGSAITLKAYSSTDKSIRWTSSLVTVTKKEGPTPTPMEKLKEIKLSATSISTYIHIPIQLVLENADASKVKWSVSSETKGYVKDGEVHALKKNCSFTVYAKYEGKTYKCKVTSEKNDPKFTTYKDRYYFAAKDNVKVYMGPHSSAPLVKTLSKNEIIVIAGELINKANNSWYVTNDNLYVYSGNVVAVPAYTIIADTYLFAQLKDTIVTSAPGENAEVVTKLPMHTPITVFGELTIGNEKWYVTYGTDKTGELRYVRAKDFGPHPHLATVPGCEVHRGNCTFCAAVTMVRRRAVHDGLCDVAGSVNAVTYGMIDSYSGGLKFAPWTYTVNGGTATYTTNTLYFDKTTNPCTVDILKKLCIDHPEGVVIYDSGEANSNNGVMHAVCLGECIPWENGTNGFYVYDINDAPYWGTQMIRLEDSSIYRNNGSNMNNLLKNITHIIYVESSSVK